MYPAVNSTIISSFKTEAQEKGIEHVTVRNIAERCGCARQTIYYHFCGTMDMIRWIMDNECMGTIYNPSVNHWKNEMYRMLCVLKSNSKLFEGVYRSKYWGEFYESLLENVQTKVINPLFLSYSEIGNIESATSLGRILTHGFVGQTEDWLKRGFEEDPREIMQDFDVFCGTSMQKVIEDYLVFRLK